MKWNYSILLNPNNHDHQFVAFSQIFKMYTHTHTHTYICTNPHTQLPLPWNKSNLIVYTLFCNIFYFLNILWTFSLDDTERATLSLIDIWLIIWPFFKRIDCQPSLFFCCFKQSCMNIFICIYKYTHTHTHTHTCLDAHIHTLVWISS